MSEVASEPDGQEGQVVLSGRYQLHLDQPLPELDSPFAKAVKITDLRASSRDMFALVCGLDLVPRMEIIPQLSRILRLKLVTPVEAGQIFWPETGGRRCAIAFERNFGERLVSSHGAEIAPMREDQLVRTVIGPLSATLSEICGRFITHRAIRVDNLFYTGPDREEVVLGECVSAPPAISQPVIYEPIDSAIAKPSGRGFGKPADDLYAFGVTLAILLHGGNPIADLSDEEIIEQKINQGSYATLLGETRVSLSLMEPLRGLLSDDPKERWDVGNLKTWVSGEQLTPKQPMLPVKAARSITFAGKEYWNKPSLSYAMGINWEEAGQFISSGELEGWIRRGFSEEETAEAIQSIVQSGTSRGGGGGQDTMIARVLMAIEPDHPIRYKSFAARFDAIMQAFTIDFHDDGERQVFAQMMNAKLPQTFLQSHRGGQAEMASLMKSFDMINFFMDRPRLGGGLERALYEGYRGWPCQSLLLKEQYVTDVEDFLPALERIAENGIPDREPIDPHIAGFCAARLKSVPERMLNEAGSKELPVRRLGILRLLAEVLRSKGPKRKYPALTRWVAQLVEPAVETFHNRAYRERLAKELARAAENGDLKEILFVMDSLEARNQDTKGYGRARKDYAECTKAIAWLEKGGLTSRAYIQTKSQYASTIVSAVVSGVAIIGLTVLYVL